MAASLSEEELNKLKDLALQQRDVAYAPYSKFRVGACLIDGDGKLFTGCNVENSSFGLTICAERTAYTKAISEGAKKPFKAIVVASDIQDRWIYPCGACRQFGSEWGNHTVILVKPDRTHKEFTMQDILPGGFQPDDLFANKVG